MHEVTVYLMIDENGDAVASVDADGLGELYEDTHQGGPNMGRRVVVLTVNVPLPTEIEATIDIPEEKQTAKVTIK